jgi:hypothetical protein
LWLIVLTIRANPGLGLFEASPVGQKLVSFLNEFFFIRRGAPSAAAVLTWMVFTFRRDDWINILGKQPASAGK